MTSVTIGNGVRELQGFSGCSGLAAITIPNSVTSLGYAAFSGCKGLTTATIPDSVISIGECAFYSCTELTSITIPDSVTSIGIRAFVNCTNLTTVTLGNDLSSIKEYAFYACKSLTDIYYHGTQKTRELICIDSFNEFLTDTTWHYLSPVSIEMESLPNQLEYRKGEELDVTGGVITTYYDYDIVEEETITPDMVTGFDSTIGGTQTLTVSFEGKTTTFDVTVYVPTIYGDANFDNKVTSADAAVVLRSIIGLGVLPIQNALNADVTGDGEITAEDAATILRYVVKLIDALPAA